MKLSFGMLWLLLALSMVACSGQSVQQKAKWDQQNILDYRYTLKVMCFCPPPAGQALLIEVKKGLTISIKDAQTGQQPSQESSFEFLKMLRIPRSVVSDNGIENDQKLVSTGSNSHFEGFTSISEALKEGFNHWIVLTSYISSHV